MHTASALFLLLATMLGSASAQDNDRDQILVRKGHRLAMEICSVCHMAAPDQPNQPILTLLRLALSQSFNAKMSPRTRFGIFSKRRTVAWTNRQECPIRA
jgi:hypothetical protein